MSGNSLIGHARSGSANIRSLRVVAESSRADSIVGRGLSQGYMQGFGSTIVSRGLTRLEVQVADKTLKIIRMNAE